MGLLYKKQSELNYNVEIKLIEDRVRLSFSADCGKFGTNEQLDEYEFTKKELLEILQKDDANGAPDYRALYEQEKALREAAEVMWGIQEVKQKPEELQAVLITVQAASGSFEVISATYLTSDENGEALFEDEYGNVIRSVTHWMPMPRNLLK